MVHSDALPDKTAGLVLLLLLFFNSLFFFFFEWPLCVGGSRAFWPTPKMFSECSLWLTWCCVPFWHACRSREWFLCVCVCAHIFILFFSTLFYGFSSSTLKEKKNNKNMAFKKRKEDDGSSGGGHVKKRVELHELRLLCLWWLRPDRRRPSFVYPALSSGNPDLPFPSPTPLHPRTCQRQTTLRTQHCAFSFKSADSTMHAFKMYNIKASGWLEGDIFTCPFTVAIVYRAVWSKEVGIDGRGGGRDVEAKVS